MAEQIPSGLIISNFNVTNIHKTYKSTSMNQKTYRKDTGVQLFKGELTLTAEDGFEGAKKLNGFISRLRGMYEEFEIFPGGAYANSSIISNPQEEYNLRTKGSDKIRIRSSGPTEIVSGSVFNIPNDTKMYTIIDDVKINPDISENDVRVIPRLREHVPQGSEYNFINPSFVVSLNVNEITTMNTEGGLIATATLPWTEVL